MTFMSRYEVIAKVRSYYERHLLDDVVGIGCSWPQMFPLRWPRRSEAVRGFASGEFYDWRTSILQIANADGVTILTKRHSIAGASIDAPHAIKVDSIDAAAELLDDTPRLLQLRMRRNVILDSFSVDQKTVRHILVRTRKWGFDDLCTLVNVARHLSSHDVDGLTPREIRLPEINAKWLDIKGRRTLIELLIGHELDLKERMWPTLIKYLDDNYLRDGGRLYDSHVNGDVVSVPYDPSVVVIVENYDTFCRFPQLDGGVCLFGSGRAGVSRIPDIPWVKNAGLVVYWGDMDADGLEILNDYRQCGLNAKSILMDFRSWQQYESLGTDVSTSKRDLSSHVRRDLRMLTTGEQDLYEQLVAQTCPGHRRVEQERLSLDIALQRIKALQSNVQI